MDKKRIVRITLVFLGFFICISICFICYNVEEVHSASETEDIIAQRSLETSPQAKIVYWLTILMTSMVLTVLAVAVHEDIFKKNTL